ncbi:hypothetical protein ABAZ39_10575 [Azospirillum argentinense]|uniref:TnsA endonuclease N-terminal domain-containing protein n=2 Tax=Azospirillum argentinense TaxID=2970906 RepID=A0A060DHW4_9PROT|nr:hypothetical protein [Azospirillum argentinense]AIB12432.1 hypothetical protein ABAZ39_10575 [Azospirillum argentinense]EZQ09825.1 hypothetical protein ABAZ39_12000 [Azospirillum argentinense]
MRTAARIVADARGGPIRRIINGRHRKPTGRYLSAKARRTLPWEDKRERAFFWHCEADANVVAYLSQPHRLEIHVGRPRPLIYFPDLRRDLANGRVEIYEIKKAYNPDDDADYDLKLRLAADVYEGLGWSFRIIEAPEIERRPTLDTAWSVQRYRHVALTGQALADFTAHHMLTKEIAKWLDLHPNQVKRTLARHEIEPVCALKENMRLVWRRSDVSGCDHLWSRVPSSSRVLFHCVGSGRRHPN